MHSAYGVLAQTFAGTDLVRYALRGKHLGFDFRAIMARRFGMSIAALPGRRPASSALVHPSARSAS